MKLNYEPLSEVMGRITVNVEPSDYQEGVKQELKDLRKRVSVKGFRPGHVPADIVRKKYGSSVKYNYLTKKVSDAVYDYIVENKLLVIGTPFMTNDKNFNIDDENLKFTFTVALAPKFTLKVDKDITVPEYEIKVTSDMVNKSIDRLCRQFAEQVQGDVVEPDSLVKGVITELNEDNSGPKEDALVQEEGIVAPKYFKDPHQRKLFVGRKVGDAVIFNPWKTCRGNAIELASMLNIDKTEVDDYKGDFEMNISEIISLKPCEVNQELFDKVFGKDQIKSEDEFKKAVKARIKDELAMETAQRFAIDAKDAILKALGDVKLPDDILRIMLAKENKWSKEEEKANYDMVRNEVVWKLLTEYLLQQFNITIDEKEVKEETERRARQSLAQFGMVEPDEKTVELFAQRYMEDKERMDQLNEQLLNNKLFNAIHAAVTIEPKKVTEREFVSLYHEPVAEEEQK